MGKLFSSSLVYTAHDLAADFEAALVEMLLAPVAEESVDFRTLEKS